jgi:hypothetical protein
VRTITFLKRTAALLVLSTLWLGVTHAAESAPAQIGDELQRQQQIYHSAGQEVYTVDRTLDVYAMGLHPEFERELATLGPNDRWLDIGAGEGRAVLDYVLGRHKQAGGPERSGKRAQVIAMSIEDRRTPFWQKTVADLGESRLKYLYDKRLRDYTVTDLGKFQLITDVIGGFSYTENLTLFVEKVMAFLEVNGSFFTALQDIRWEDGSNRPHYNNAPFLTEIAKKDGSELKVCSWLKSISCAQVTCEPKPGWRPPLETFHIRKTCDEVSVPALEVVHYQAGTPPERRFRAAK